VAQRATRRIEWRRNRGEERNDEEDSPRAFRPLDTPSSSSSSHDRHQARYTPTPNRSRTPINRPPTPTQATRPRKQFFEPTPQSSGTW
jgi:hypothetical protein